MEVPLKPLDESDRLYHLKDTNLLYTPIDKSFERITRLVKAFFDVPVVAISLIDDELQWFKSIQGLDICETARDMSFCGHAILQDEIFIVNDASTDIRFFDNPLVSSDPNIRFYAGFPLRSAKGYKMGTLCLIDHKPRQYTDVSLEPLKDFAGIVEETIQNYKQSYLQRAVLSHLDEAKRKVLVDPVTRLWNRDAIESFLSRKLILSKAQDKAFGFILIHLDNIQNEHIIKKVAKKLLDNFRSDDLLSRWGDATFAVIVDTDQKKLLRSLAERLRKTMSTMSLDLSASVVLVEPLKCSGISQIVKTANSSLIEAKKTGKSTVIFSDVVM